MTFVNAKKLHNEDEVIVKRTSEVLTVLQAYLSANEKNVIVKCNDGNTYYHRELR